MRLLSVKVSASERSELVNPPENTSRSDDKVPGLGGGVWWWRWWREMRKQARFLHGSQRSQKEREAWK